MKEDATNFVRACDHCQCFANYSSLSATLLIFMMSPWPFPMWGIDLIGELPKAKGDIKYVVVMIKKEFAVIYHPRRNGQIEAANKIIKHTLKTKLKERKWNWPEELPKVLWSYITTPRSTKGESPFMLTYGYKAMVPIEVGPRSLCRDRYAEEDAEVN
ncbi:uncharacterized protein LOC141718362 [Apium graveolens]|uniref:uncharacterized protein LOC141718362 n=1 Tax=Apium graveolens TaxID=4045 RepID=UPI003D794069